ncbi:cell division FtsA domain-containing protein [Patescibacteria group bacterium]
MFAKKKKIDNYALALDIGTAVIKALIVKVDFRSGKGEIVGVGKVSQRLGDMHSGAVSNIEGVVATADKAITKATEMAKVDPRQAVLGIAGELVKGAKTTVHYERLKPDTKISITELREIVDQVQKRAFTKVRKQLAWETGHSEIDVKLINAAVVDVHIDGYRVTNPLGFQGKDVSIGIFNAYAPLVHLGALQSIAADLRLDLLSITAEPYAVARAVSEDTDDFGAIFIDIGGGTTDIAVVHKGGVEGTKMLAIGGRTFTKRLVNDVGKSYDEAEKIKLRYSANRLSPEGMLKIKEALGSDIRVWLSGVELALSEFKNVDLLPSRIMLCGGGSLLPGIKESLLAPKWTDSLPFAKQPSVAHLHPKDVKDIIDKTRSLKEPQDITPMALGSIAMELAGEESVVGGVLSKVADIFET